MAVEEELITRLLGFAGLAAFTGQRVYFIARPQGDALPSVTLQLAGGVRRESAMGGDTGYVRHLWRTSAWAASYLEARDVSEQVCLALQRWPVKDPAYSGVIEDIYAGNEEDGYDPETEAHMRARVFEIVHREQPT